MFLAVVGGATETASGASSLPLPSTNHEAMLWRRGRFWWRQSLLCGGGAQDDQFHCTNGGHPQSDSGKAFVSSNSNFSLHEDATDRRNRQQRRRRRRRRKRKRKECEGDSGACDENNSASSSEGQVTIHDVTNTSCEHERTTPEPCEEFGCDFYDIFYDNDYSVAPSTSASKQNLSCSADLRSETNSEPVVPETFYHSNVLQKRGNICHAKMRPDFPELVSGVKKNLKFEALSVSCLKDESSNCQRHRRSLSSGVPETIRSSPIHPAALQVKWESETHFRHKIPICAPIKALLTGVAPVVLVNASSPNNLSSTIVAKESRREDFRGLDKQPVILNQSSLGSSSETADNALSKVRSTRNVSSLPSRQGSSGASRVSGAGRNLLANLSRLAHLPGCQHLNLSRKNDRASRYSESSGDTLDCSCTSAETHVLATTDAASSSGGDEEVAVTDFCQKHLGPDVHSNEMRCISFANLRSDARVHETACATVPRDTCVTNCRDTANDNEVNEDGMASKVANYVNVDRFDMKDNAQPACECSSDLVIGKANPNFSAACPVSSSGKFVNACPPVSNCFINNNCADDRSLVDPGLSFTGDSLSLCVMYDSSNLQHLEQPHAFTSCEAAAYEHNNCTSRFESSSCALSTDCRKYEPVLDFTRNPDVCHFSVNSSLPITVSSYSSTTTGFCNIAGNVATDIPFIDVVDLFDSSEDETLSPCRNYCVELCDAASLAGAQDMVEQVLRDGVDDFLGFVQFDEVA